MWNSEESCSQKIGAQFFSSRWHCISLWRKHPNVSADSPWHTEKIRHLCACYSKQLFKKIFTSCNSSSKDWSTRSTEILKTTFLFVWLAKRLYVVSGNKKSQISVSEISCKFFLGPYTEICENEFNNLSGNWLLLLHSQLQLNKQFKQEALTEGRLKQTTTKTKQKEKRKKKKNINKQTKKKGKDWHFSLESQSHP